MKKRESALWKQLSRAVPSEAMAVRVENSLNTGMPDVLLTYRGKTVLIELKCDPDEITSDQKDWARRWARAGGKSWFLIAINDQLYFIPGNREVAIIDRWRVKNCHEVMGIIYRQ